MTRKLVGMLMVLAIAGGGCAAQSAKRTPGATARGYQLVEPPDVPDGRYPGGTHVLADAPLASWHPVAGFATHDECESSRTARIDASIDAARAAVGERAKYQMPVRRAVNARCVPTR